MSKTLKLLTEERNKAAEERDAAKLRLVEAANSALGSSFDRVVEAHAALRDAVVTLGALNLAIRIAELGE